MSALKKTTSASTTVTFDAVRRALTNGQIAPVYLLHGAEGFYIDRILADFENLIPEEDREFGLRIVYASQIEPGAVMDICLSVPMMCERQVVIIKEAQVWRADQLKRLARYALSPSTSTVLVIAHRGAECKSKDLVKAVGDGGGVVYTTPKIWDSQLPVHAATVVRMRGMRAGEKAISMLCEHIGADLSRMYGEVGKLVDVLGRGADITPEAIERNIGYSKEYNQFELIDAISMRDASKVWRIVAYFDMNPKALVLPMLVGGIFGMFANAMVGVYAPDRSPAGIKAATGAATKFDVDRTMRVLHNYNAFQIIEIIDVLRRYDAMSKGQGSRQAPAALLRDMMIHILSAPGRLPV